MARASALRQTVRRGRANRPGAPHDHVSNRARGFAKITRRDDHKFVRQQSLIDEQDSIALGVESDSAEMTGAAIDSDIHGE